MHPTLFEADLLEIGQPSRICVGDVILFVSKENLVVHRVVGIASEGISTRGDNNNDDDPELVAPENVVGIVVSAWRGQLWRRIYGGRIGQIYQFILCGQQRLYRECRSSLAHSYTAASQLGLPSLIEQFYRPRIVQFNRNDDIDFCLMLGGHIIGHYCQSSNCWQIHPPFRLLVDEAILPCAEMKVE
jgi:hypothetical protein